TVNNQKHEKHINGVVAQAVAKQVYQLERPQDRHGQHDTRNDGGENFAQENEDHHDHEGERQDQGKLHVVDRFADGVGPVVHHVDADTRRNLDADRRQELLDGVHDLDGVGARLPVDRKYDAALILEPRGELVVFHAVDD